VAQGRRQFLSQFPSLASEEAQRSIRDPGAQETFRACKLDWSERDRHASVWHMHRDLLALRRSDPVFRQQAADRTFGAVLGPRTLLLRYFGADVGNEGGGDDRLVLVSLDTDRIFQPTPEPLLAPPPGCSWQVLWSSEDVQYGGGGTPPIETEDAGWRIPGHAAIVMTAKRNAPPTGPVPPTALGRG
jgi:maltooligosyltrehalose trehalohydrolase